MYVNFAFPLISRFVELLKYSFSTWGKRNDSLAGLPVGRVYKVNHFPNEHSSFWSNRIRAHVRARGQEMKENRPLNSELAIFSPFRKGKRVYAALIRKKSSRIARDAIISLAAFMAVAPFHSNLQCSWQGALSSKCQMC